MIVDTTTACLFLVLIGIAILRGPIQPTYPLWPWLVALACVTVFDPACR